MVEQKLMYTETFSHILIFYLIWFHMYRVTYCTRFKARYIMVLGEMVEISHFPCSVEQHSYHVVYPNLEWLLSKGFDQTVLLRCVSMYVLRFLVKKKHN